jgi:pilus assembly protein CpaF
LSKVELAFLTSTIFHMPAVASTPFAPIPLQAPVSLAGTYRAQVLAQIQDMLAPLRPLFEDEAVNEIMVNGPDQVFYTRDGVDARMPVRLSASAIRGAITLAASYIDREVGERAGRLILSARLPGFRLEAILPPVAVNGPSLCIRRHCARVHSLDEYVAQGVVTPHHADVLRQAVAERGNLLIVGATGSGKTTLMNTVLGLIPPQERLFVIETVHELQVSGPNHVLVECDEAAGVTARIALRTGMRYAPRRIIVGELRGPEAFDWLDAANTGHPGSAATIHANGAAEALPRLENLVLMAGLDLPYPALRAAIARTVQWLFFIERVGPQRRLTQALRLRGWDRARDEYSLEPA